ncbi:hypothetical protein BDW75DRAFT_217927, partial [Aspergillus navahoensis]
MSVLKHPSHHILSNRWICSRSYCIISPNMSIKSSALLHHIRQYDTSLILS